MNCTSILVRPLLALLTVTVSINAALAGSVAITYTELPLGTTTDLTAVGTYDWVKWGLNDQSAQAWTSVRKDGVTPIINSTLNLLGSAPSGTAVDYFAVPNENVLNFDWSDGDSPASGSSDTLLTETILPAQPEYPHDLGMYFGAEAVAETRVLDVWVQGFNTDMLLFALMSGGESASVVVSPTKVISGNNYSSGVLRVAYSGVGESVSITAVSLQPVPSTAEFPNAGIFAAAIVPEPSSMVLAGIGAAAVGCMLLRRRRAA